jgi:hypothetical protein
LPRLCAAKKIIEIYFVKAYQDFLIAKTPGFSIYKQLPEFLV